MQLLNLKVMRNEKTLWDEIRRSPNSFYFFTNFIVYFLSPVANSKK